MSATSTLRSTDEKVTLLLSTPDVTVSQLYEGETMELSRGTLELSLIPADPDPFLVLKVNEVEVPLTTESQVFKKGEKGYLLPWREVPGAVLEINLSSSPVSTIESLDMYLVDLTSMPAPETRLRNQLALVDERGNVVGGVEVSEESSVAAGAAEGDSKAPVYVAISESGQVQVEEEDKGRRDGRLVQGSKYVSSGILYGANAISSSMERGSLWINSKSPASDRDVEFHPIARASTRRIHQVSNGVSYISNKTFGYVASLAESAGGKIAGRRGQKKDAEQQQEEEKKEPGLLAHAGYALVNVLEAVDAGGKQVLESASKSMGSVVQHRYGSQAGTMASELGDSVKNVALVYFDAKGISHRALLTKSVKGGVKARMSDGRRVVLNNNNNNNGDIGEKQISAKKTA